MKLSEKIRANRDAIIQILEANHTNFPLIRSNRLILRAPI